MRNSIRFLAVFPILASLCLVTGCQSVSINSNQYLGVPTYAPTDPAQIQILRKEPTEPHVQLGEVRAEPSSDDVSNQKIETSMREAAAKMGANAVVIVFDRTEVTGAMFVGPWYGHTAQLTTGRVVVGVAIRYTPSGG